MQSNTKTLDGHLRQLRSCVQLLNTFEKRIIESLKDGEQADDPQAVMICRGLAFGRTTLETMIGVAQLGEQHWVCLSTLCRPLFEVASKLLWASRKKHGWHRLQSDSARPVLTWAREAKVFDTLKEYASSMEARMTEILSRTDSVGARFVRLPNMKQILEDIEKDDRRSGFGDTDTKSAAFQYTNLYRKMCFPVHGHIVAIAGDPSSHLTISVKAAVVGTFSLLRLVAVVGSPDLEALKKAVATIGEKIVAILKGDDNVRLDDIVFSADRENAE